MARCHVGRLVSWTAVVGLWLATPGPAPAVAADDPNKPNEKETIAGLEVAIWRPSAGNGPFPLVLFSHGLHGCREQSNYLMRALADHGMLVAAPDHKDSGPLCDVPGTTKQLPADLLVPLHWNPNLRKDRGDDIKALRAALEKDAKYGPLIDPRRTALVGHSLGGYTALGLAGAWPGWKMDRITAVVGLASYIQPLLISEGELDKIAVPVMLQGGRLDLIAPEPVQNFAYGAFKAPGCKIIYPDAGHLVWTSLDKTGKYHDATAKAAVGFLTAAFAGRTPTNADLPSSPLGSAECKSDRSL